MSLTCPSESDLLQFAMRDAAAADGDIGRHVRTCAPCTSVVQELRAVIHSAQSAPSRDLTREGCLDEASLALLLNEDQEPAARGSALDHLAHCGHCRRQLASLGELMSEPAVAAEVEQLNGQGSPMPLRRPGSRRRTFMTSAGMLAAAAVLVMVIRPSPSDERTDHRGPTMTAAAAPLPLSPAGDVASASTLVWTAVPGADRYRVTLFDASGRVVFEAVARDTTMMLPDSVVLVPGQSYLWKVEARTSWERWTASELIEFRVSVRRGSALPTGASSTAMMFSFASLGGQSIPQDSLHRIASRLSDSALVIEAKNRPLELRESLSTTLARAVNPAVVSQDSELLIAARLASAYERAWSDAFLSREVARFVAWTPARRLAKVRGDSMRRAGISAFSRDGAQSALVIWRRTLTRFNAIPDTAGSAATLGNIGAALAYSGRPDSAQRYLEKARTLAMAVGDKRVEANATSELAGISESRRDFTEARARYAASIALRERIGDSRGLASDYNNLAGLARTTGDVGAARSHLQAALALNRRDGRSEVAATNLVNLASLASVDGDLRAARSMYGEALATWRAAERWADVADVMRGLGDLELRRGNYPAARTHLQEALAIYRKTGPVADEVEVRRILATTLAAQGDLQNALSELQRAFGIADSGRVSPTIRGRLALARADLSMQLNLLPEAERHYERAHTLFRQAGDRVAEAEALDGRALLLLRQDNMTAAEPMLTAALRTQIAAGAQREAALTRLSLASVAARKGDTTLARRHFVRASADLDRIGDRVAAAAALGERASLEAAARFPAAAESLFRAGIALVGERAAPEVTWRLHSGLGHVLRAQGSRDEAARELRTAIADIERSGHGLALPERRSAFLIDKWDVYVDLAQLESARGRAGSAFEVSERLRTTEMLGMLAKGRVDAPADTAADLIAREQDLRHRIAELTRDLGDTDARTTLRGPDVARTSAVSREALLRAQESYAELMLEVRERAPRHGALITRTTSTWRDVARRLTPDEAFIEYLLSDTASMAFVITRDTLLVVPLGANRRQVARMIDFVRGTLQPRGSVRLDSLWRAPLRELHADLIGPVEASGALRGKSRLTIVPHAELHYLPFAALVGGGGSGRFLVERYGVSIAPSASVWIALGDRGKRRATEGTIAFAPRPKALPASEREVTTLARLGGGETRTLIGAAATESAFRREAPSSRVIHLATYGILNKQNPLFSFVELAPGGRDDGRLEVHEVFGLRLAADLVVLSACQTGLAAGAISDVPAGDDWIGLARAFLSAGADRVMASLWPVQDQATAVLMEKFYEKYQVSPDPEAALAHAQRAMIASATTSNPYYWAGFEMVGGR